MVKLIIIILCVSISSLGIIGVGARLKFEVYFESLCPDSIRFFKNQLVPVYTQTDLWRRLDTELVSFGHATVDERTGMTCQHGPKECEGNRRMGCIIERSKGRKVRDAILTIGCLMSRDRSVEQCVEQYLPGHTADEIEECTRSRESLNIMKRYAARQGRLEYVPYLTFQNKPLAKEVHARCEKNLAGCIRSMTKSNRNYVVRRRPWRPIID